MSSTAIDPPRATRPRRPWVAALASVGSAPVGHIYAGAPLRGFAVVAIAMTIAFAALAAIVRVSERAWFFALAALVITPYVVVPLDAYRVARRRRAAYRLRWYNRWYVYCAVALALGFGVEYLRGPVQDVVQGFSVSSGAMIPTLLVGDRFFVDKRAYADRGPERLDIVIFEYPQDPAKTWVKRVIGLPGETIEVRQKRVWIDGVELAEPYVAYAEEAEIRAGTPRDDMPPYRIPEGSYFLMGDNRDRSYDSRFLGAVVREKIFGRVAVLYFSLAKDFAVRWDRIGKIIPAGR